jgi:hypothetical protein
MGSKGFLNYLRPGPTAAGMAQGYYHRIDLDDPGLTIAPRVSRASSSGASNVPEH